MSSDVRPLARENELRVDDKSRTAIFQKAWDLGTLTPVGVKKYIHKIAQNSKR